MKKITPLNKVTCWLDFSRIISILTRTEKFYDCCNCRWAGLGVLPGQKEKHCLEHAFDGECAFYKNHKEFVDKEIERYGE